jgi:uncharacterized protein with GYD domain
MAHYLFQAAYTSDAWAALVSHPHNRVDVIRPVIERLGGHLACAYFAFGEYDVVGIMEMPDDVSAAAFSLAASAGGGLKAVKTTPLLMIDDGIEAMRKAAGAGYRPPGR